MQTLMRVHATTVLGDAARTVAVARQTPTGEVALGFASAFQLPANVPWGMRDNNGSFLDETATIGSHVAEGEELQATLTPKAHLG
ncbi:MAG: hypothetical protein HY343_01395 [Lentisphaerae bacterium]|nr:hypothetical protein [Lentisphaerota bacterium]